ncbi:uncharacterized protein C8orf59 homolog isoform X1 [Carlito syrichta]|uniref:Uncharacterized protein C8orf59 homolog isoform X1 n=1 Tax=Carlito syrichta TaxID=1868482 RepID=A0A1U7UAP7_CARSF|nr:uncharacterized protein C8orf59 homolog isoform X1 [Carlito syrichta]
MAKNKFLEQQTRIISVLQMAGQKHFKPKNKAKPVTTDLKKRNIINEEKVNRVNTELVNIQKELALFSNGLSLEPQQKELIPQQCHESKPVNVDEATR